MVFNMSELERLVHEMAELNTAFYPLQIVFAALAIGLTMLSFIRPSKWVDRGTKLYLGILYSIISWGVAVCYFNLRGGYYLFTALNHSLVALLFFSSIRKEEISFNPKSSKHGLLSVFLVIYGVFIYPLVELILGYTWPGIFVFGALCPTGIYTVGTLSGSTPAAHRSKTYMSLLGLVSLGAIVCGLRTVLIGGVFDVSYFGSGVIGLYILFKGLRSAASSTRNRGTPVRPAHAMVFEASPSPVLGSGTGHSGMLAESNYDIQRSDG